jgi:hypothetical protein
MTSDPQSADEPVTPHVEGKTIVGVTKQKRANRSRKALSAAATADDARLARSPLEKPSAPAEEDPVPTQHTTDESDSAHIELPQEERDEGQPKAGSPSRPSNVAELIEAAYAASSKFKLKASEVSELEGSLALDDSGSVEHDRIVTLAANDLTLRGLANFLTPISQHASLKSRLRDRVSDLATAALWQHTIFKDLSSQPLTPGGLPDVSAKRIWQVVPGVAKRLGQSESQGKTLRTNAVTVFVLLRVIRGDWTLEDVASELGQTLWSVRPEATKRAVVAAAILLGAGEYDVPTRLGTLHERAALEARKVEVRLSKTEAANNLNFRRARDAEDRVAELDREAIALQAELTASREQIVQFKSRLKQEQEQGSVARSHHADDYEVLRTQIVRQLSRQTDLLSDGLHALRNNRHDVAEEFVDRALTAITREVASLKQNGDSQ